jgi:hypothetical protein
MFLQQMPLSWLENLLITNPGVATFPGLSSFQDAPLSGVTIPNPNATNANNANPNVTAINVVTRAQVLTAFTNLMALAGELNPSQVPSLRARLLNVNAGPAAYLADIYDVGPAGNNAGGYTQGQIE